MPGFVCVCTKSDAANQHPRRDYWQLQVLGVMTVRKEDVDTVIVTLELESTSAWTEEQTTAFLTGKDAFALFWTGFGTTLI